MMRAQEQYCTGDVRIERRVEEIGKAAQSLDERMDGVSGELRLMREQMTAIAALLGQYRIVGGSAPPVVEARPEAPAAAERAVAYGWTARAGVSDDPALWAGGEGTHRALKEGGSGTQRSGKEGGGTQRSGKEGGGTQRAGKEGSGTQRSGRHRSAGSPSRRQRSRSRGQWGDKDGASNENLKPWDA